MSEYLILNIITIFFPLIYSFEKTIKFYKTYTVLFMSTLLVGIPYVIWDIIATKRGDWSFNPEFLTGIYIFNLPLEEILFFITVPYSMIFLYRAALYYLPPKTIQLPKSILLLVSIISILLGLFFLGQHYTSTVLIYVGVFFLMLFFSKTGLRNNLVFWIYLILGFIPFFVVNYFLTSLPVVSYNPETFSGIRIVTIPAEDFIYTFSLVGFYILIYEELRIKMKIWI
ncbi:MAG: lycopene cyclase domain-containing protein [Ignavibacteriae bacterium HGW-Ignavibacteriae-2]|nr:MAG: lycopene cyclase domain-containing protein [Ignavibacteriae bacterium HGW-Ignavibacteriae-2]